LVAFGNFQAPLAKATPSIERVAAELHGQRELGDGLVHRIAFAIARELAWNATARRAKTALLSSRFGENIRLSSYLANLLSRSQISGRMVTDAPPDVRRRGSGLRV
jgi:hypothetical protein